MIQWIVMDMDGTLLNSQDQISERTRALLMQCQKQGIKLILASGRSQYRLYPYAKMLDMKRYDGYFIEVNGMAYRRLRTNERVLFQRLNHQQIQAIFNELKKYEGEIQGYLDDTIYLSVSPYAFKQKQLERIRLNLADDFPWTGGAWGWLGDTRNGYPYIHWVYSASQLPYELNKMTFMREPEYVADIMPSLCAQFPDCELVRPTPRAIEFSPKGVTKGSCLEKLMQEEQIGFDEVLVLGDGENDIDMFSKVKYSVAMGNAASYVKERAYDVTLSHDEDGVAAAIMKYCLHD